MSMAEIVYFLCAAMSFLTATILYRNFLRTAVRFLLWSSLCFAGLALTNVLLFLDMVVIGSIDLSLVRNIPGTLGFGILIYGFVWELT